MKADELPAVEGCRLMALDQADSGALQDLLERCTEFEILVTSAPPSPQAAAELLTAAPPGLPPERKQVIGVMAGGELIGVIDLLRDFPDDGTWYLGLLLLAPERRGDSLGKRLYGALSAWITARSGERIRLAVQAQNANGLGFWARMGFVEVDRVTQNLAARENQVFIMEHRLTAHAARGH